MKTVKKKLLFLFITQTAVIMLTVLVLYNIAVSFYFDTTTRKELQSTFSTMNLLVEKKLTEAALSSSESADSALVSLSAALTASRLSGNTEFFILNEEYEALFPKDTSETLPGGELMHQLKDIDFDGHPGEIRKTEAGGIRYVAGMPFDEIKGMKLYIVFVADASERVGMILAINLMLVAVMLISLLFGLLLAGKAASGISSPIKKACEYAGEIGNGNFIPVPPDQSSLEISRLCEGMNEMSMRLKASDEAQKLFFQNASHELRTPLMAIQGYAEAIENRIGDDPKEAASIIKEESIKLTSLVGELLTLSRMDADPYGISLEKIDLDELLTEYVYRLEGLAMKEHKIITFDPGPGGTAVSADERLLLQAVGNTASNCLRYAQSEVVISLARQNCQAIITVRDDGPGFDETSLPRLFDRFYKGKSGNFGLGLAIAKKSMELLHGSITALSGESGAVFEIRLDCLHE